MYKLGCLSGLSLIRFIVTDVNLKQDLGKVFYFDQWGTRSLALNLKANKVYKVSVEINWHFGT